MSAVARDAAAIDVRAYAHHALSLGLCVMPPREDGSKRPLGAWKQFQGRLPTANEVDDWYVNGRTGFGLICGEVSGGALGHYLMIELEKRAVDEGLADRVDEAMDDAGLGDWWMTMVAGYCSISGGGGVHILVKTTEPIGNLKLASRPSTPAELVENPAEKRKVLIETRGEGGFTAEYPSHGRVHDSGNPYTLAFGSLGDILTVPAGLMHQILDVLRSFDQMPEAANTTPAAPSSDFVSVADGGRPGDEFDLTGQEVLEAAGFVRTHENSDRDWTRPGKEPRKGSSATVWPDNGRTTLFSSSIDAPAEALDDHRNLTPWQLHAFLNHKGDFPEAARQWRRDHPREHPAAPPSGHSADPNGSADQTRYKRWSITELLAADLTYQWDATGLLVRPTYGADSGELKTLKSYFGDARAVGLASGTPVLGHWHVPERRRVLMYVAEGGRIPWTRRLIRMCDACGIGPEELDGWLETIYVSGPLDSAGFRDGLTGHLQDFQPHLVHLDPLYPFQPMSVDANRLAQVGAMLNEVQRICADHGASFWVTAHMNQTGSGFDLKRISGAGISEWADSWVLLKHRTDPDVDGGHFRLTADIGSRQWGGTTVNIDFDIGRFDAETGTHDGSIRLKVWGRRGDASEIDKDAQMRVRARTAVMKTGRVARKPLSKNELAERSTGAAKTHIRAEIAVMIEQGVLVELDVRKNAKNGTETPLHGLSEDWRQEGYDPPADPQPEPDPTLSELF